MWAQVDMNEFYKQFEEKKKKGPILFQSTLKKNLRALFYVILIMTLSEFIAEQLSYSFSCRIS